MNDLTAFVKSPTMALVALRDGPNAYYTCFQDKKDWHCIRGMYTGDLANAKVVTMSWYVPSLFEPSMFEDIHKQHRLHEVFKLQCPGLYRH